MRRRPSRLVPRRAMAAAPEPPDEPPQRRGSQSEGADPVAAGRSPRCPLFVLTALSRTVLCRALLFGGQVPAFGTSALHGRGERRSATGPPRTCGPFKTHLCSFQALRTELAERKVSRRRLRASSSSALPTSSDPL